MMQTISHFASRFAILIAVVLSLPSCETLDQSGLVIGDMAFALDAAETDSAIAELVRRSLAGDKDAQLELGIAFEEGRGVEQDIDTARRLYGLAARDDGGAVYAFVPGVGGSEGRVVSIANSLRQKGLEEAQLRLERLTAELDD